MHSAKLLVLIVTCEVRHFSQRLAGQQKTDPAVMTHHFLMEGIALAVTLKTR